jgi:hypothetical protein
MDAVRPGVSGWLTQGTSAQDIERALLALLDSREEIKAMIESGAPRKLLDELIDPSATVAAYREAVTGERAVPPAAECAATVSAVVVRAAGSGSHVVTLRSLERQTHAIDQLVLACDGIERLPPGFDASLVDTLEVVPTGSGLQVTRNTGLAAATGQLILLVDAGMELAPDLVERLVSTLSQNPRAAYATAWADGLDPSAAPLGNFTNLVTEYDNAAVAPLLRRQVLERGHRFDPSLGDCAGRAFYLQLAADELFGSVVPERLLRFAPVSTPCTEGALERSLIEAQPTRDEPMSWIGN